MSLNRRFVPFVFALAMCLLVAAPGQAPGTQRTSGEVLDLNGLSDNG